jgi:hypothetical protein
VKLKATEDPLLFFSLSFQTSFVIARLGFGYFLTLPVHLTVETTDAND